jgi:hypothetical protein
MDYHAKRVMIRLGGRINTNSNIPIHRDVFLIFFLALQTSLQTDGLSRVPRDDP